MKNSKTRKFDINDDYDDEDFRPAKKKDSPRRRQVKNWKKVWGEHQTDYDEHDEFFGKWLVANTFYLGLCSQ